MGTSSRGSSKLVDLIVLRAQCTSCAVAQCSSVVVLIHFPFQRPLLLATIVTSTPLKPHMSSRALCSVTSTCRIFRCSRSSLRIPHLIVIRLAHVHRRSGSSAKPSDPTTCCKALLVAASNRRAMRGLQARSRLSSFKRKTAFLFDVEGIEIKECISGKL